jgi:hypothetical protein
MKNNQNPKNNKTTSNINRVDDYRLNIKNLYSEEIQNTVIEAINKIKSTDFSKNSQNSFVNFESYISESIENIKILVKKMIEEEIKNN